MAWGSRAEHVDRCISNACQQWVNGYSCWLLDLQSMHAEMTMAHLSNDAVGLLLICHGRLPWLIDVPGWEGLERRDEVPGRQKTPPHSQQCKVGV